MHLTDIVTPQRIKVPLTATTKEGVIEELVNLLANNGDISDGLKALTAVMDRERTRTTGIGNGLAIPHGKTAAAGELIMAVGRPAQPVNFDSVDSQPVNLVILLLSPLDKTGPHIQALARVSRLMSLDGFRKKLLSAATAEEIYKAIQEQEAIVD